MTEERTKPYEWDVILVGEDELKSRLNSLDGSWEVFSIVSVLRFDAKVMGTPVPSGVEFAITLRRPTA